MILEARSKRELILTDPPHHIGQDFASHLSYRYFKFSTAVAEVSNLS